MLKDRSASAQPLVSRPAYGSGHPAMPVAESGLPTGDPGGKGQSLDKDIPGTATYSKPEGDTRDFDKAEPGSIYRKDGPDSLNKPQDDAGLDERDHSEFKPRFTPPGGRPKDDSSITKWPYRTDRPQRHYATHRAQTEFIAGLFLLRFAHEVRIHHGLHTAARISDLEEGLNPKVIERGATCSVGVKRADVGNLRWIFTVDCGNGAKVVRLKATRERNVIKLAKMDLDFSCSCPAWRWLGPEHHAKFEGYLDGKPRGTASYPEIRDPDLQNRVCKHVAAVLSLVRTWEVPVRGKRR